MVLASDPDQGNKALDDYVVQKIDSLSRVISFTAQPNFMSSNAPDYFTITMLSDPKLIVYLTSYS